MALESRIEHCFTGVDPFEIFVARDINAYGSKSETRLAKIEV